jgi:hypothetical protein
VSFLFRGAPSSLPHSAPTPKALELVDRRAARRANGFVLFLAVETVWILFAGACGVQSPPRPPRVERPQRVTDLAVAQVGHSLELSFTPPVLATDGERLTKRLEIEIFRTITPPGQSVPGLSPDASPWATLEAKLPDEGAPTEKTPYADHLSDEEYHRWQGSIFTFQVRTLTRGFRNRPVRSDFSNVAQTALVAVSKPVENLRVETTEKALHLKWSPAPQLVSGRISSKLAGYQIYLSKTGKPGSFEMIGESPSETFVNENFEFGRTYFFKVRAVYMQHQWKAETEDSSVSLVVPRDTFPPAPPTGLTIVYATTGVELVWNANTEPDLAGYNVYRRTDSGPATRLNSVLLQTPVFTDTTAKPGHRYAYWVNAVDLAGNGSSPSEESLVDTR